MYFRKRIKKKKNKHSNVDYSLTYGYYDEAAQPEGKYPVIYGRYKHGVLVSSSKKKKKKNNKIMGFDPIEFEAFCDSIPLRNDILVERVYRK